MNVKVNGKEQSFDKDAVSVTEMLTLCDVSQPDMVSVQLNGEFVQKEHYQESKVKEGDVIDFLYFMGGGNKKFNADIANCTQITQDYRDCPAKSV